MMQLLSVEKVKRILPETSEIGDPRGQRDQRTVIKPFPKEKDATKEPDASKP